MTGLLQRNALMIFATQDGDVVTSRWNIDVGEASCKPYWGDLSDKVCLHIRHCWTVIDVHGRHDRGVLIGNAE